MANHEEFREAAASCLDIAQTTPDENARARLLMLAQKFNELAVGSSGNVVLAKLLDEFNDAQMLRP
jgi:ABC-type cobalamin transport system ATPase subunit